MIECMESEAASGGGGGNSNSNSSTGRSGSGVPQPPDYMICPISQDLMRDPVLLVGSGHSYERTEIEEWLNRGNLKDPLSGKHGGVVRGGDYQGVRSGQDVPGPCRLRRVGLLDNAGAPHHLRHGLPLCGDCGSAGA